MPEGDNALDIGELVGKRLRRGRAVEHTPVVEQRKALGATGVFPGADASPWTIQRWFDNWMSNRDAIVAAYGERWFRIWRFFLAWSVLIGEQGNAACFQVVANKNLDQFNRQRWILDRGPVLGDRLDVIAPPDSEAGSPGCAHVSPARATVNLVEPSFRRPSRRSPGAPSVPGRPRTRPWSPP